ncbi:hypothetical protein YSY43_35970 [Paenibacillus sp. YSY-4.3]
MSDQILTQILDELKSLNNRMGNLEGRQEALESRQISFEAELKEIKANTADIPLIRQAVLETLEITKRLVCPKNLLREK